MVKDNSPRAHNSPRPEAVPVEGADWSLRCAEQIKPRRFYVLWFMQRVFPSLTCFSSGASIRRGMAIVRVLLIGPETAKRWGVCQTMWPLVADWGVRRDPSGQPATAQSGRLRGLRYSPALNAQSTPTDLSAWRDS